MTSISTKRKQWHEGLKRCGTSLVPSPLRRGWVRDYCGTYYEGFVDGEKVAECLEIATASTFGTQSSHHVTCSTQTTENVSYISIHKSWNKKFNKKIIQDDLNTPRPASQNTSLY